MSKIKLNSGIMFDFLNPTQEMITLDDITHNLSKEQRFSNCLDYEWSVLQHQLFVYKLVKIYGGKQEMQYKALHHDDTEAYMHDIPTPLKSLLKDYKKIYESIEHVISQKFNIELRTRNDLCHECDKFAMKIEDLMFSDKKSNWHTLTLEEFRKLDIDSDFDITFKLGSIKQMNKEQQIKEYLKIHNSFKFN